MLERKNHIAKLLKKYDAATVKMLYGLVVRVLCGNEDFRIAAHDEEKELCDIFEEQTDEKVDFSLDAVIDGEALEIFKTIEDYSSQDKKLKKAECIELLSSALADDTLFEGFCLAFFASDEMLADICKDIGCEEYYQLLSKDPVFQMRRRYMRTITQYTLAAVNLYGVVHITELEDIILEYEKAWPGFDKYVRSEGCYKNTLIFTPRYFSMCALQQLVGNTIPEVGATMDGLIIHALFLDEYHAEVEQMMHIMTEIKSEGREIDLDEVFSSLSYYSYRELFNEASEKPMYVPSKKEFLKYADLDYYEVSLAQTQLRRFLERKYLRAFAHHGEALQMSAKEVLDEFMDSLHFEIIDADRSVEPMDPNEFVQYVFDMLHTYGIDLPDLKQANELLGYIMNMVNSTRLWWNHGYTPMELAKRNPIDLNNLTVVPGSSNMAKMLDEEREQLARMGIHVDLDASATNVTTHAFGNGLQNGPQTSTKKIYPNDPCPCGSGKKFKKCCGKKG